MTGKQSETIRRSYGFSVREMKEDSRSVDVIASSEAIDGWGEVLVQDWDLERYKKNPVVLYGHNAWGLPIGHASNVRVEKSQLLATLTFVDARANPTAEQVWQGILQGSLRAVSVGFRSKSAVSRTIDDRTVFVLSGNELIEISVVPIPANPEAVAIGEKSLNIIRDLVAEGTKAAEPSKEIKTMSFATIAAVLSLAATATEAEIVDKAKSIERGRDDATKRAELAEANVKTLLSACSADSIEKALGAIEAGKAAVSKSVEQAKQLESLERSQIIAQAKSDKKLTPAQEKGLEGKSLDFVKGFLELQHPNPALETKADKEPETKTGTLTHDGKTWLELKPGEKHDLFVNNKDLYEAMRDAAQN